VIALLNLARQLLADVLRFAIVALRPTRVVAAENLFLRRQLALYVERGVKSRRPDIATRLSLAVLSRLFDWRASLVVVRPEALIRWHRAGFRLLWALKSRPGRPAIPVELRALIRRMAAENPLWGEERIANELQLKLGLRVSPRTVRKYVPKVPPGRLDATSPLGGIPSRRLAHSEGYVQPSARRDIHQRVQAELLDLSPQQSVKARLRYAEATCKLSLRQSAGLHVLSDPDHQLRPQGEVPRLVLGEAEIAENVATATAHLESLSHCRLRSSRSWRNLVAASSKPCFGVRRVFLAKA
jgi:hypothetical protein